MYFKNYALSPEPPFTPYKTPLTWTPHSPLPGECMAHAGVLQRSQLMMMGSQEQQATWKMTL